MKRVDQAVFATIEAVVNGEFTGGGVTVFGLANIYVKALNRVKQR